MPKIKRIGESKKDRLIGGETWTVLWVDPDPAKNIGLVEKNRLRLEERFGLNNGNMFPDQSTAMFNDNKSVKLKILVDDEVEGFLFQGEIKVNGKKIPIWIEEGSTETDTEAEIWLTDPRTSARPGGVAGLRR